MTRTDRSHRATPRTEPEIEALLSIDASESIVDRLMSLPDPDAPSSVADDVDRAVAASLQSRLARALRDVIDNAARQERPHGRDAA